MKNCIHIELLLAMGFIGIRQLEKGGQLTPAYILQEIKEGKNGHLSVGRNWTSLKYCPLCSAIVNEVT